MVDSGEEAETTSSIEWGKIHYSHLHNKHQPDPKLNGWSMVSFRNQTSTIIFPPIHHENLHISTHLPHDHSNGVDSCPYDREDPPLAVCSNSLPRWLEWGLRILRCRINGVVGNFVSTRGVFRSFISPAAVSAAAMLLMYLKLQRRRKLRVPPEESVDDLVRIIKRNDEKINQLTHQVEQMNQLLLLTLRRLPPVSPSG